MGERTVQHLALYCNMFVESCADPSTGYYRCCAKTHASWPWIYLDTANLRIRVEVIHLLRWRRTWPNSWTLWTWKPLCWQAHPVAGLVLIGAPRSLQGRPPFTEEVNRLVVPVDPQWVRQSLTWCPPYHRVTQWYLEDRVRDGAGVAASVWRETFQGLRRATPPIPSSRLIVYEDTGHLVLWEQPERVAADLTAFVSALAGSP